MNQKQSLLFDRWPRYASRKPWTVVLGVAIVIAILFGGSYVAGGEYRDSFTIPGAESQEAFDILAERFPARAGDAATVVLKADDLRDPVTQEQVEALVERFAALPGVAKNGVISP